MKQFYENNLLPQPVLPKCPLVRSLAGQKAIVTGGSSGIGRAVAIALGHAGADVLVNYNGSSDAAVQSTVDEIERCGSCSSLFKGDVSKEEDVLAMFACAQERMGRLDILVNNAGIQRDAALDEMTVEQWDRVLAVNLRGQFLCTREASRVFKRQGVMPDISCAAGKILFISSVHDVIPWAGHANYAASKGGVSMFMKTVAQELAPYRIRANAIAPGAIRTPINQDAWSTPEAYAELMKLIPYKRIGEPEEIGRAAVWLLSDDSDYVTGTTLYIDGGMTLYPGFEVGG